MHSSGILNTKGTAVLSATLAMGLILAGCISTGDDGPRTSMSDDVEPPANGQTDGTTDGPTDPSDLGPWEVVRTDGVAVGYRHGGYKLMAKFDPTGANPTIAASSPMHQPTVGGTWSGKWSARYTALSSDYGEFDETDDGTARISVTIAGSDVEAVLTYSGINIQGLPSSISSDRAPVTDGRFAPSATVSVPTESGGRVSRTFSGLGQFGGTDQNGVVGYVSGQDFRSVFYGDRQ